MIATSDTIDPTSHTNRNPDILSEWVHFSRVEQEVPLKALTTDLIGGAGNTVGDITAETALGHRFEVVAVDAW